MNILFLLLVIALLPFNSAPQRRAGWRGIVPLHSTRADVERILGASKNDCKCIYEAPDVVIHVEYATDRCKGVLAGWNVPTDTVLRLTVRSTAQQHFSELKVEIAKYTVRRDDTFTTYYVNQEEGIEYAVLSNGVVNSISYIPSNADDSLRCSGFSIADRGITNYGRFDEYGDLDFRSETGRLDSFAIALNQATKLKGYILVYAGKVACPNEARKRANRARSYLINKRGLKPTQIEIIDGGYRQSFLVELYALPQGAAAPNIGPTLDPSKVQIVKSQHCR